MSGEVTVRSKRSLSLSALAFVTFIAIPGIASLVVDASAAVLPLAMTMVVAGFFLLVATVVAWFGWQSVRHGFALDDGGLHVRRKGVVSYESFLGLRSVFVERGTFQRLVAVRSDGTQVLSTPLVTVAQQERAQRAMELLRKAKASRKDTGQLEAFARNDRSMAEWVEHLEALRGESSYRLVPTDPGSLTELMTSLGVPVDVRAATAYLLVKHPDVGEAAMAEEMGEETPQLIREMVRLAGAEASS
jgi:hypothetical protein